MEEAEGAFQPKSKVEIHTAVTALTNRRCVAFNFIFSILVSLSIFIAVGINELSIHYLRDDTVSHYFTCGWNEFYTDCTDDTFYGLPDCTDANYDVISSGKWLTAHSDCIDNFHAIDANAEYCSYLVNPRRTGKVWFYCNMTALISLSISLFVYGVILCCIHKRNYKPRKTHKIYIFSFMICFQSLIPTMTLLIAIIHWFKINAVKGCWGNDFFYYYHNSFQDKTMGKSMIFDILAVVLLCVHLICSLNLITNPTKRKEENLLEGEGCVAVQEMAIIPSAAVAVHYDVDGDIDIDIDIDGGIKLWFEESVAVPNNYKDGYYTKFIENGFDNFVAIKSMTDEDLKEIGVEKLGHRKTVIIAIQQL